MNPETESPLRKGMLLVAMPMLLDPNFRQTVVLLCEHGAGGSMGLVVNRPTTVPLSTLFPEAGRRYGRPDPVYVGGPVQSNTLVILYRGDPAPSAHPVLEDLHLTGDLQILDHFDRFSNGLQQIRFYLGYAGWAPGQLETECAAGSWKLLPADGETIFKTDPLHIWPSLIRDLDSKGSVYADMPPDPRLN